jgi:hypothetical protein
VFRGSEHIDVWDNDIHDFPGGGVNAFYALATVYNGHQLPAGGWDLLDVSFNTIHGTSRYSPENTSGISFYGAVDTSGSTLANGYGYEAVGNYVYDVLCLVDSSSGLGTYPYVTDGNAISIDSLSIPYQPGIRPYTKPGLIEGNLLVGNGGRAVHVFNSVDVDGLFNTAVGNLRTQSPAIDGGVEMDSNLLDGRVRYEGNVIMPLHTPNSTDHVSFYVRNVIAGGTQPVPAGNIDRRRVGVAYLAGDPSAAKLTVVESTAFFMPVNPDRMVVPVGFAVPDVLDAGPTRNGMQVAAGAVG